MPAPKQRHTKSRRNKRRSHHALRRQALSVCPKCAAPVLPHHLCANCGTYAGHELVDVLKGLTKKERKSHLSGVESRKAGQAQGGKELSMSELSQK